MGLFLLNRKEYTSCHLEIDSSLHADAGQYKVTLENKLGAASATINVKVIGTQSLLSSFHINLLDFEQAIIFTSSHLSVFRSSWSL